jgi:DNA recombination protein RmuC
LLIQAREQLSDQFRSLANDILEEKAKRFTEQNQTNIGLLLDPLKTKLQDFQTKVEEVYIHEGKERAALAEQVRHLLSLNKQLSEDDSKQLVIDSKMSLNAYNDYANAENDLLREAAIGRHVDSVRTHISQLSAKNHQSLYELKSLDFVVMFIPVEPAFILAITHDGGLWEDAWRKNVLLVSPSTLLFVVRTVAHLWRQEQQNRNVQDIAKRGAELYDKLTGFVEDLTELGKRLSQARQCYESASAKFSTGRGNVIRQAEMLRDLGVKPSKSLPQTLVEAAFDESMALPGVLERDGTDLEDSAKP